MQIMSLLQVPLLLFLFEYRAATLLIKGQFPGSTATSISKFEIDGDVISLDGRDPVRTRSEIDGNGRIRVRIRRSTSSAPDSALSSSMGITPRASNLSGAEIFSVNTPAPLHQVPQRKRRYCIWKWRFGIRVSVGESSTIRVRLVRRLFASTDTPRLNFNELDTTTITTTNTPFWVRSPVAGKVYRQQSPAFSGVRMVWESPGKCNGGGGERQGCKDVVGGT